MEQPAASTLLSPELLARLEKMELVSRKIFRGRMKGERRSPRKGQSVEFADFRNYVPGDDLRFVDWNTYARLEKLFLKMFLEEEDLHFYALIDASSSMDFGEPTKLKYAVQLAAALGFIGLVRGDRVKIETIGPVGPRSGPGLSRPPQPLADARPLSEVRFAARAQKPVLPLAEGVKNFCLRNSGKGIVVLISDLMDKAGYESALRYLVSREMDVYVIHVLSPEEFDPDVQGDLRLVDCEDGDVAEVTVTRSADEAIQADAGGVRRVGPRVLHPPRHVVSAGPQRNAGRAAFDGLFGDAGVGAIGSEDRASFALSHRKMWVTTRRETPGLLTLRK